MTTTETETVEERTAANLVTVRLIRQIDRSRAPSRETYGVDVFINGYHVRIARGLKSMDDAGGIADNQMRIAERTVAGLQRRIAERMTQDIERICQQA